MVTFVEMKNIVEVREKKFKFRTFEFIHRYPSNIFC